MNNAVKNLWMVRAGKGGFAIDQFINKNMIAIGWNEVGKLNSTLDKPTLKELLKNTYPNYSKGQISNAAGQFFRFLYEFEIGDFCMTYNSKKRIYALGEISSEYQFNSALSLHHYRRVKWLKKKLFRDNLSETTKKSLGPLLSIFKVKAPAIDEILDY